MGTRKEQFRHRLLTTFQVEAKDYINGILADLSTIDSSLDKGPLSDSALIEPVFRQFHNFKGASQAIGFDNVGRICQLSENILSAWKKQPAKANKTELSSIVESALSAASALNIDLASSSTTSSRPTVSNQTFIANSSTILANRLLHNIVDKDEEDPFLQHLPEDMRSMVGALRRHVRSLGTDYHKFNNQLQSLLNEVKRARLAPVRPLLEELEIAARRITRQLAKKVRITITGGDLELDRSIIEALKVPLLHLVRNALDHGLESSEERLSLHKSQEGHLNLKITSRGTGMMEFVVSDDGRGIQTEKVLAAAKQQGLISEGSEADSLDLIFTSGISTSSQVTELSGRGLGMAIVREKVEMLKGSVRVKTKIGEGTSFILSIPTSLATFEGLLIAVLTRTTLGSDNQSFRESQS